MNTLKIKTQKIKKRLAISILITIFFSCGDQDCTKIVNIPKWDAIDMTFVDNPQEVPCYFEEPVTEPVN